MFTWLEKAAGVSLLGRGASGRSCAMRPNLLSLLVFAAALIAGGCLEAGKADEGERSITMGATDSISNGAAIETANADPRAPNTLGTIRLDHGAEMETGNDTKSETSWSSQLPHTRSMAKLLKQIQQDASVKTMFKATLKNARRSNRGRSSQLLKDAEQNATLAEAGNHSLIPVPVANKTKCHLREQPVLCKPLHERVLTISTPDIVQATLKATGHHHKCRVKQDTSKSLTAAGEQTRLIVFVALGGGLVCEKQSHDWRARFPQYMGKLLNATVVTWMIRYNSCSTCTANGEETRSCVDLMKNRVDLLVILGSGRYKSHLSCNDDGKTLTQPALPDDETDENPMQEFSAAAQPMTNETCSRRFTDLWHMMQLPWARGALVKVHFPLRRVSGIVDNSLFNFDRVIDDSSFSKPPSTCTAAMLSVCPKIPKQRRLMYIARLHSGKGQLAFLDKVDPMLMRNYTLHLYGGSSGSEEKSGKSYLKEVKAKAKEKKIRIRVHGEVGKGHLYAGMCTGVGLVHFAEDKNPRSVYEAVQAGLPVFINKEAQVSKDLEEQPFVVATNGTNSDNFNTDFTNFLSKLRQDWAPAIASWTKANMEESIVYTQLCEQMCLCGGSHSVPPECQQVVMAATERSHRLHHHHHHPADIHRDGPASGVMPDTDGAASVEQLALPPFSDL